MDYFFSFLFYSAPLAFLAALAVIAALVRSDQLARRERGQLESALLAIQAERDEASAALVDAFHKGWAECDADWKATDPYQRGWACCEATLQTDQRYQLGYKAGERAGEVRAHVELLGIASEMDATRQAELSR